MRSHGPLLQSIPNLGLVLGGPEAIAPAAVRVHDLIPGALDNIASLDLVARRDGLHVLHDLLAEVVQG